MKNTFGMITIAVVFMLTGSNTFCQSPSDIDQAAADRLFQAPVALFTANAGDAADVWLSSDWFFLLRRNDNMVEGRNADGSRQVFLDASPFAQSGVRCATRLGSGFLLAGRSEPEPGDVYSILVRYNDDGSMRTRVRLGQDKIEGRKYQEGPPIIWVKSVTEMPGGELALFWVGKSHPDNANLLVGVTLAGPDLALGDCIYGPVDLGFSYFPIDYPSKIVETASDVRFFRNRLYIVDAYHGTLVVAKPNGEILHQTKIQDPTGEKRPLVIAGWSLEPDVIHFQVILPKSPEQAAGELATELFSYSHNGHPLRRPISLDSVGRLYLKNSETGRSFAVIGKSIFSGVLD